MRRVTAGWHGAWLAGLMTASAGCDWIPVRRRVDPALYPVSSRTPSDVGPPMAVARADEAPPERLPPLPVLTPYTDAELARATAPTPLLDEALARAVLLEQATVEALAREESPPEPRPVLQLADPVPPPEGPIAEPVAADPVPPPFESALGPPVEPRALDPAVTEPSRAPADPTPPPRADAGGTVEDPSLWMTVMGMLAQEAEAGTPGDGERVRASLQITDCRLCTRVDGFQRFQGTDPNACRAGQRLLVYCELEGVDYEPAGVGYRSEIGLTVELVDAVSGRVIWSDDRRVEDVSEAPRRDYFLIYKDWALPESLEPGRYLLNVAIADRRTGERSHRGLTLTVLE